jgi:acyl-CoA thioesterase I
MSKQIFGWIISTLILGCSLAGCSRSDAPEASTEKQEIVYDGTIVAVGDSLTAGLRVNEEEAYPARLENKLREGGYPWRVINAGISGETSSGVLSRINWVLKLEPDIVILETGANDGLRGTSPNLTRKNLEETVSILQENGVTVVLAGMKMVTNLGRQYLKEYSAVYPEVAKKYDLIFIPFFLERVAGKWSLNQQDGIHPNGEGYKVVAETVYPFVVKAIERRGDG